MKKENFAFLTKGQDTFCSYKVSSFNLINSLRGFLEYSFEGTDMNSLNQPQFSSLPSTHITGFQLWTTRVIPKGWTLP